jgi:hypothetical protein
MKTSWDRNKVATKVITEKRVRVWFGGDPGMKAGRVQGRRQERFVAPLRELTNTKYIM